MLISRANLLSPDRAQSLDLALISVVSERVAYRAQYIAVRPSQKIGRPGLLHEISFLPTSGPSHLPFRVVTHTPELAL